MKTSTKKDVLSVANGISVVGVIATLIGSVHLDKTWGVLLMGVGRLLDIVDGIVARKLHSSEFGGYLDASLDKLGMFAIIISAFIYGSVPLLFIVLFTSSNVVNVLIFFFTKRRGIKTGTNRPGKLNMFAQGLTMFCFSLSHFYIETVFGAILQLIGLVGGLTAVVLAIVSLAGYIDVYRSKVVSD